jgi:hypothetical protein
MEINMEIKMEINANLLQSFEQLLTMWKVVFPQYRTFLRARRLTFGLLTCLGSHLTSNAICAVGRQFLDWSADYRLLSRCSWDPHRLFDPIFDRVRPLLQPHLAPVLVALDDTACKKSGKKIPGVNTVRDPQSPPFHVNLFRALRFVQASLLISSASSQGPARALPVRFEPAPLPAKPKKTLPTTRKKNTASKRSSFAFLRSASTFFSLFARSLINSPTLLNVNSSLSSMALTPIQQSLSNSQPASL